jgi:hypothetical protein
MHRRTLCWDEVARRDGDFWARPMRLRRRRLPGRYLAGVFAAVAEFVVAPYGEEAPRCLRARGNPPRA